MSNLFIMLLVPILIATIGTLFAGVVSMAVGGPADDRNSTRLMFTRVGLQALAVGVIVLMFFVLKY